MPTTTTRAVVPKARYYMPGTFFSDNTTIELSDRSIDAAVTRAPENAFAFVLIDVPVVDFEYDQERFRVIPIPQNESGKHYLGGQVFTCDELRALAIEEGDPSLYDILIANITRNPTGLHEPIEGRAIRCRTGNWQQFEDGDQIVALSEEAASHA